MSQSKSTEHEQRDADLNEAIRVAFACKREQIEQLQSAATLLTSMHERFAHNTTRNTKKIATRARIARDAINEIVELMS